MKFDKQRATLFLLKAVSYTVNTLIVVGLVAGVCFFVYYLFLGGTATIKRKPPKYMQKTSDATIELRLNDISAKDRAYPPLLSKVAIRST